MGPEQTESSKTDKSSATTGRSRTPLIAGGVVGGTVGFLVGASQTPAVGPFLTGFLGVIGGGVLMLLVGEAGDVKVTGRHFGIVAWALNVFCVSVLAGVLLGGCIRVHQTAPEEPLRVAERFGDELDAATLAKLALLERRLAANGVDSETKEHVIEALVSRHSAARDSSLQVEAHLVAIERKLRRVNQLLKMLNNNREFLLTADDSKWKPLEKPTPLFGMPHPDQANIDDSTAETLVPLVEELFSEGLNTEAGEWRAMATYLRNCLEGQRCEIDALLTITSVSGITSSPTEERIIPCVYPVSPELQAQPQ